MASLLVAETTMVFVPMRRKHLRAVMQIEQQVYSQPWTTGLFLSELALRAARDYTVAMVNGNVVGYAGLSYLDDEAHLTTIAVAPEFQGEGIATQLMLQSMQLCLGRGVRNITLEVRVSGTAALGLYRKFGFAPAGVRKSYYSDPVEDALIMWAHDIDSDTYGRRLSCLGKEAEQ